MDQISCTMYFIWRADELVHHKHCSPMNTWLYIKKTLESNWRYRVSIYIRCWTMPASSFSTIYLSLTLQKPVTFFIYIIYTLHSFFFYTHSCFYIHLLWFSSLFLLAHLYTKLYPPTFHFYLIYKLLSLISCTISKNVKMYYIKYILVFFYTYIS